MNNDLHQLAVRFHNVGWKMNVMSVSVYNQQADSFVPNIFSDGIKVMNISSGTVHIWLPLSWGGLVDPVECASEFIETLENAKKIQQGG